MSDIEEMEKQYPQYKPQKLWRKDQENIIMITITIIIMIITMTMTMTEIVSPETGIDHIVKIDCRDCYKNDYNDDYRVNYRDDYRNDYRDDYRNDYRDDCRKENHRNFKDQKYKRKYRDNYENTYEDRYNKDNHGDSYRNKDRNKNKDQHRDDSYDQIRGRSKEKECSYDDRKDDSFEAKLKRVHKSLQTMSKEKEIAIALMLVDSENLDYIVDSIHSQADVDHLIAERIECAKSQKGEKLSKDHHDNISIANSQTI